MMGVTKSQMVHQNIGQGCVTSVHENTRIVPKHKKVAFIMAVLTYWNFNILIHVEVKLLLPIAGGGVAIKQFQQRSFRTHIIFLF